MTNFNVSITARYIDQMTSGVRGTLTGLQQIGRAVQDINKNGTGSGFLGQIGRMHGQIRGLVGEVRNLSREFGQLGRAMTDGGGRSSFAQRQVADLRQVIDLQRQILANNNRMVAGPGGGGGRLSGGGGSGWLGRSGFSPNASLVDRGQYRAVNFGERSLVEGALSYDTARTRLGVLGLSDEVRQQAEAAAANLARQFSALSRADILETFGEVVTQFRTPQEAFDFLPELLRVQQMGVLSGDTTRNARQGMLQLLRGIGLSGRLTDAEGNLTLEESRGFLDAYQRARIVGGRDVDPSQAFQLVKYMKSTGQTISTEALLEAFIAMPDLRASTYGNQLNMMIRQLTGGATMTAQQNQARAGLIRGGPDANHPGGAGAAGRFRYGGTTDEELLRTNPNEWVRTYIMGPNGFLRRQNIDPLRSSQAQIAAALRPLFSDQSGQNIVNMIVAQTQEWRNQIRFALGLDLSDPNRQRLEQGSSWVALQSARSQIISAMGAVAENFEGVLLPPLQALAGGLRELSAMVDPQTGNPWLRLGLLGGGAVGGFMLLRRLAGAMGPTGRMLLGGGLGFAFGGVTEALMGALMLRSFGVGAAGAAGAAGAGALAGAVGATLGRRILSGLWSVIKGIPRFLLISVGISAVAAIIENWETVSARLKAIWEDLARALPTWLGGQGRGASAFTQGGGLAQLDQDLQRGVMDPFQNWVGSTAMGRWLIENGWMFNHQLQERLGYRPPGIGDPYMGFHPHPNPGAAGVTTHGKGSVQNLLGPITITVTVNATTNADPHAIGDAAGSAVGSHLRGLLGDMPAVP